MNDQTVANLQKSVSNLENKSARIYFISQDTKGNAKASIRYIYQMAMSLKNEGFNPIILHEKPDYTGVSSWLGEEYMSLPHRAIEGEKLEVSPEDLIVIPEIYGFIMDQIKNLPCGKIVLCQAYDYMVETLQPGQTWSQFNFLKCITTSNEMREYVSNVMRGTSFDIITPYISEKFEKQYFPPKPIIAIHARDQRDSINIIKTFYLKFPQYRWVTFRDMRALSEEDFAKGLQDAFLSVWVDPISSFGTYPLECMKVGVPIIGVTPRLKHSWMNEDNGIWIPNQAQIVDMIADFIQNWIEDNIKPELYENMEKTAESYSSKTMFDSIVSYTFSRYMEERLTSFKEQLTKLEETVE